MAKKKKISLHKVYLLFVIIAFGVFGYLYGTRVYNDFFKKEEKEEIPEEVKLKEIKEYGYTLKERDGELFKTNFEELNTVLTAEEVNYEEYAKLINKLFVIDYYTLSNKRASTDVGGLEFLYKAGVDNFLINAQENMYKTIQTDFDGNRKQQLPTVSSVEVSKIAATTITYNNKKFDGYKLIVNWEYEKDLGYEKTGTFYVIKINEKLYMYGKSGSYK